ncbi:hypothetical protein [Streptomyces niveiscabiei]|uniref:hypothetical protein n=1 Tax=Streptomyces niveiscabiei TaxID=164115 RepID=UPI0038F5F0B9
MTAQPDHPTDPGWTAPPMRTLAELRLAISLWGFPGDPEQLERELGDVALDDLTGVREIIQAYRNRVFLRNTPAGMAALARPTDDVADELRRKMAGTTR